MDEQSLERALRRVADARAGRAASVYVEAALERSRAQMQSLGAVAEELEQSLPGRVEAAVQEGLRREVQSVARTLAEIRGLLNQTNRRLERLEQELIAERGARIDDLEVLVDLVSSGWRGVDARLAAIERQGRPRDPIPVLVEAPLAEPMEALAS